MPGLKTNHLNSWITVQKHNSILDVLIVQMV